MTPALISALTLMLTAAPPPEGAGEPLPPGAPTDSYELAAWCYGALNEYLLIYEKVIPDLKDMDRMFGTPVVEAKPYSSDMAAARVELKMLADSVSEAEKASPQPIAERGAEAVRQGQHIWSLAEAKSRRELARAWMLWALPDRCDSNARELAERSRLFGKALKYNTDAGSADATKPNAAATDPPQNPPPAAPQNPTQNPTPDAAQDASPAAAPASDSAPSSPAPAQPPPADADKAPASPP
jgi:hypothetical protein